MRDEKGLILSVVIVWNFGMNYFCSLRLSVLACHRRTSDGLYRCFGPIILHEYDTGKSRGANATSIEITPAPADRSFFIRYHSVEWEHHFFLGLGQPRRSSE